ncbi:MAG: enoyl-CoA hydratase-related protein [Desulfatibacillaceae bacterium]
METRDIILEIRDRTAVLTLNRPDDRNVITGERIISEIEWALKEVEGDPGVCCMVLTGAGKAFSAGGDVKAMRDKAGMFAGTAEQIADNYRNGIQRIPMALHEFDVPTIAAVNGPAIGAGCDLACMCDIRIAGGRAKFGETFAALGIIPGDGGAWFLPRAVGYSRAAEMMFTCRIIDAGQALAIGLVNEVVDDDGLMDRALDVAAEIARQPPGTLRRAKRLLRAARYADVPEMLELSARAQGESHVSQEHADALERFFASRGK